MPKVTIEESKRFMEDSLRAAGAPEKAAKDHAELLLHADLSGHFSHGLNRLEFYINDMKSGATNPTATPVILKETVATAWVDGNNALGATVGHFCMDLAIRKAKEAGIGWVSAKGCNHFGMAGWWAKQAEKEGLIGMAFTNSSPIMVPTRAKEAALGTNPVALCAPAKDGDSLLVDMAATAVAMGKIEVQLRKGEPVPEGWAYGPDGKTTTDAKLAFETGKLLPLGGEEATSGYKGYGLSALVEVFCSGFSGANPSQKVRKWSISSSGGAANLGQCFAAIDPAAFAPGFADRITDNLQQYRGMEPVDPSLPVLAPGDKERMKLEATKQKGTITYAQQQIDTCQALAKRLGIRPIEVV